LKSTIGFVDQSVRRLGLQVFRCAVPPDQFCVFAREAGRFGQIEADFHVIGASHLVTLRAGGRVFSELLACAEAEKTAAVLSVPAPLPRHCRQEYREEGLLYRFELQIESTRRSSAEMLRNSVLADGDTTVAFDFPAPEGSEGGLSWTVLGSRAVADGLEWRSLHWYASEEALAVSDSRLTLGPPGRDCA
jgi:hypothetical protein